MVAHDQITDWLDGMEVSHEPVDLDELEGAFHWALTANGRPFRVLVAHPQVEFTHLVMQIGVTISDDHKAALESLSDDARERFVADLRIELLKAPVGIELELDPDAPPGMLRRMLFALNVLEDPLQRSGFFRRMHQLETAALLGVSWVRRVARFGI